MPLIKNGHIVSNTGRTWWTKGHIPWNLGLVGWRKAPLSGKIIECTRCGRSKYFEPNQLKKRPCKFCSVLCARKSEMKVSLKYSSIHSRISREWGKADICEQCGKTKSVDWANKSGKYLLDRNDWVKLCRKDHISYDNLRR